jgi:hypothetical protein
MCAHDARATGTHVAHTDPFVISRAPVAHCLAHTARARRPGACSTFRIHSLRTEPALTVARRAQTKGVGTVTLKSYSVSNSFPCTSGVSGMGRVTDTSTGTHAHQRSVCLCSVSAHSLLRALCTARHCWLTVNVCTVVCYDVGVREHSHDHRGLVRREVPRCAAVGALRSAGTGTTAVTAGLEWTRLLSRTQASAASRRRSRCPTQGCTCRLPRAPTGAALRARLAGCSLCVSLFLSLSPSLSIARSCRVLVVLVERFRLTLHRLAAALEHRATARKDLVTTRYVRTCSLCHKQTQTQTRVRVRCC